MNSKHFEKVLRELQLKKTTMSSNYQSFCGSVENAHFYTSNESENFYNHLQRNLEGSAALR